MIKNIHSQHAHFMISVWASFGPHTKAYRQLDEQGLLFDFETWPQSGLSHIWPPRTDYPSGVRVYDAFSQKARDIYWQNLKRLYDMGTDGWWMDSTDPDFFNPREADYAHKAGDGNGTWRSLRNAFPLATVKGVYEHQRATSPQTQKRVFIMTRSAFAGQQHYGSNMWSGDVTSSWDMLRKQIPAGLIYRPADHHAVFHIIIIRDQAAQCLPDTGHLDLCQVSQCPQVDPEDRKIGPNGIS
jgi:alpha-D-xyloside xylohydrolase